MPRPPLRGGTYVPPRIGFELLVAPRASPGGLVVIEPGRTADRKSLKRRGEAGALPGALELPGRRCDRSQVGAADKISVRVRTSLARRRHPCRVQVVYFRMANAPDVASRALRRRAPLLQRFQTRLDRTATRTTSYLRQPLSRLPSNTNLSCNSTYSPRAWGAMVLDRQLSTCLTHRT